MKRWLVAFIVWLATTTLLVPMCFFGVMLLNGPHGGVLPEQFGSVTLLTAWAIVVSFPILLARYAWRHVR